MNCVLDSVAVGRIAAALEVSERIKEENKNEVLDIGCIVSVCRRAGVHVYSSRELAFMYFSTTFC
jgi:hypothetical protein